MKNGNVCIYARVSTSDGKQDFSRQVLELRKIIKGHGYEDNQIIEYSEMISGYSKKENRPQLNLMMDNIRENPSSFSCLYISELSRLGRNPKFTRDIIDELTELKVPVYIQSINDFTIDESGIKNSMTNMILQVLMEFSDFESQTFKTRSKSGLLKSAREGKMGGGKYYPYGYTKDIDKRIIVDEVESEVIRTIFKLYKEGYGIRVISNILNNDQIPTRTNKSFENKVIKFKKIPKSSSSIRWSDKQIHDILKNTIYKGQKRYKGEIISCPKIIDEVDFDYCLELLKNKNTKNTTSTYLFLLKNLIICGVCGRNYFGRYKPVKNGDKVYKCSSTLKINGTCGNKGINIKLIESVIYSQIVQSESILKYISNTDQIKSELEKEVKRLTKKMELNYKSRDEKSKSLDRLLDLYLNGGVELDQFQKKNDLIKNEIERMDTTISLESKQLSDKNRTLLNLNNPVTTKDKLLKSKNDRDNLQLIFNQLFEKIIINTIDKDNILCTIFLKIDNIVLKNTIKVLFDISSIRKKQKVYRYKSMSMMEYDPSFNNNVLITNILDIKNEFDTSLLYDWIEVDESLIIEM